MARRLWWFALVGSLAAVASPAAADQERDARKVLESHGLRVRGSTLAIQSEPQLGHGLREAGHLQKKLVASSRKLQQSRKDSAAADKELMRLKKRAVELNARLAGLETRDVLAHNKLADGSTIQGTVVTVGSIRVGKFTARDVKCTVLGPEATNALALLGTSFPGNFKFEIDADAGTLEMTQVEIPGSEPARKRR